MSEGKNSDVPRLLPAVVTFLHPFSIVLKDPDDAWKVDIEQINNHSYDYIRLHEITGGLDVGLTKPYHMLVGFDGALALPPIPELQPLSKMVQFFNKVLAALLVGGVYCEAVSTADVDTAQILDWKYIRVFGKARTFAGQLHHTLRLQQASLIHSIQLLNPREIQFSLLRSALRRGNNILEAIVELTPEFLLRGISWLVKQEWTLALSNIWIVNEQLLAHLWKTNVIDVRTPKGKIPISGRGSSLKDFRTWTASAQAELLYQIGIIDYETLKQLSVARRARNELHHKGIHPSAEAAQAAYEALKNMLQVVTGSDDIPLFDLVLDDYSLQDIFQSRNRVFELSDVHYWMPFPKLPGEDQAFYDQYITKDEIGRHENLGQSEEE